MMATEAAITPPGIANNPSNARCLDDKFKECKNLVHVCPKFCPDSCTVDCQSCKPICSGGSAPPPTTGPTTSTPPPVTHVPPPSNLTTSPPPAVPPPVTHVPPPSNPTTSPPPAVPTPQTPSPPPPPPPPVTPVPPPSNTTTSPPPPVPTPQTPSPPPPPPPPVTPVPPPSNPTTSPPPPVPTPQTPSPPPPPPVTPVPPPSNPTTSPPPVPTPQTPPTVLTPPASPTPPSAPTLTTSTSPKTAICRDTKYPQCYNLELVCPTFCPGDCEVDCNSCKPICKCDKPGSVCQDPRFIGGDGITFYFHGKKDQDFCLLSDSNLHINAHFIGRRNSNMKRDFTWVQSIGLLLDNHQIFIGAQKTTTWDDSVDRLVISFDGEPIFLPESENAKWESEKAPAITFTRSQDTNGIVVEAKGKFKITATVVPITEADSKVHNYGITKEDCFAHLDLGFKFYELSDEVDGVLGKTYRRDYVSKVKMGVLMPVMGGNREFSTSSLFATDCKASRFGGGAASQMGEYSSLSCGSGMDGRGVVCKR